MTPNQYDNRYTDEDKKFIKDNYTIMPVREIAEVIGHPISSVYTTANQMGFKKWTGKLVWGKSNHFNLNLTEGEIGYIAGLMDADGSIGSSGKYHQPRVQITNTVIELMKWLLDKIGGVVYREKSNTGRIRNSKQVYRWQLLRNKQVAGFLKMIIPYLIVKRKQAVKLWEIKSD